MVLVTNGGESILVWGRENTGPSQLFRLDRIEDYGIKFYGRFHRFEAGLTEDAQLSEQPNGRIGASCDAGSERP